MEDFLRQIRDDHHNFDKGQLNYHIGNNPFDFFHQWFKEAFEAKQPEDNAFVLSTVNEKGQPSSRILYLKELDDSGFVFYTNYASQKGSELSHNPKASMLFFWNQLERQVRIEGVVEKIDSTISDAYFESRPRASKLGAWASHQSQSLSSRDELMKRLETLADQFPTDVPRPPHWGGYKLIPTLIEFWQGRPSRLHDRLIFERDSVWKNEWNLFRKNP
jgi:pyridoxamine 5'-phosphate oxidase